MWELGGHTPAWLFLLNKEYSMIELTKEDYELSHEVFVKKFRHLPNYFKLLELKKKGYTAPVAPKVTKSKPIKKFKTEED
jgi:hypothetical protein